MPLSVGLDSIPQTTITEQEDEIEKESKSSESEKSFMDYTELRTENDEPELITSADIKLKNYCRAQDAAYWDEEVKDMMESVKRVHQVLSEGGKIEEVFRFRTEEYGGRKEIKNEDDLKNFIEEIEKMDTILKVKQNEERQARLSRIQVEEESKNILTTLPFAQTSGGMKFNLEEFMKLLNEVDSNEHDSLFSCKAGELNGVETGERGGGGLKEDKKEKASGQHQKINNLKFIERNIQLAKCGRGTLSLTDEEKSRIETLLADVGHSNAKRVEGTEKKPENAIPFYGIDEETKCILSQIDKKLEAMSELRKPISWFNKNDRVKKVFEVNEKGKEEEERNRLKKINQLLKSVNSISGEEIYPLTDEELENLIRESKEIVPEESAPEGVESDNQSVIKELVSSAKLLMPKFKYRFSDN